MSKSNFQPTLGFVMPNQPQPPPPQKSNSGGGYPPYQPAPGYPPQYNNYPQPGPQGYPGHQPFPPPVQQQPSSNDYQRSGINDWTYSSSYNYLRSATSFHVKQKVEMIEALMGWETGNKYTVKDQSGNKLLYVGEESNMCGRQLCNARRAFTLSVKDATGRSIMIMDRPLDCSCFCGLICADSLSVSTPNGQVLGSVVEEFNICFPKFSIRDARGQTVLKIEGPMCPMAFGSCASSVVFKVVNKSGVPVGTISKEWSGLVRELFTDADYFSMSFPIDLDPAIKAVCLAALFLIDYEYFERGTLNKNQGGRRLFG